MQKSLFPFSVFCAVFILLAGCGDRTTPTTSSETKPAQRPSAVSRTKESSLPAEKPMPPDVAAMEGVGEAVKSSMNELTAKEIEEAKRSGEVEQARIMIEPALIRPFKKCGYSYTATLNDYIRRVEEKDYTMGQYPVILGVLTMTSQLKDPLLKGKYVDEVTYRRLTNALGSLSHSETSK
jgi:hypothetical protein